MLLHAETHSRKVDLEPGGTVRAMPCKVEGGAMRFYAVVLATVVVLGAVGGSAQAQYKSRPIDTEKLVVKPTDTATNIVGTSFKYVSRLAAGYLDNNAMIRTVNNLFGKTQAAPSTQGGLSPLPDPSRYPSTYYQSPIQPVMPKYSTFRR